MASFRSRKTWMTAAILAAVTVPFGAANLLDADDPPIVKHMEALNTPYKALRRVQRTGKYDADALKLVIEMQDHALKSMHVAIPMIDKAPEAKRKEMVVEYKQLQGDVVIALIQLEVAIEKGDAEACKALIDKLGDLKKAGHDKFVPET